MVSVYHRYARGQQVYVTLGRERLTAWNLSLDIRCLSESNNGTRKGVATYFSPLAIRVDGESNLGSPSNPGRRASHLRLPPCQDKTL
jgi:hypothetical protein